MSCEDCKALELKLDQWCIEANKHSNAQLEALRLENLMWRKEVDQRNQLRDDFALEHNRCMEKWADAIHKIVAAKRGV